MHLRLAVVIKEYLRAKQFVPGIIIIIIVVKQFILGMGFAIVVFVYPCYFEQMDLDSLMVVIVAAIIHHQKDFDFQMVHHRMDSVYHLQHFVIIIVAVQVIAG